MTFLGPLLVLAVCTFFVVPVLGVVTEGCVSFEDSVAEFAEHSWFCVSGFELELSCFVAEGGAVIGGSLVEVSGDS